MDRKQRIRRRKPVKDSSKAKEPTDPTYRPVKNRKKEKDEEKEG